jgi:GTP pyrophosphokinase
MEHLLDPSHQEYNRRSLSIEELEERLLKHGDSIALSKVIDAYEMARSVHAQQTRNDGTPFFDHSARTVRILMDELHAFDTDLIIAAFLHDVLEDSKTITKGIIEYNFGSYVAYVVEMLTKDLAKARIDPDGIDLVHVARLASASADCLIIKLAARLDNIRCLSFNLKKNPIVYITNTLERYVPLAEASGNQRLYTLAAAIRSEANTFLG